MAGWPDCLESGSELGIAETRWPLLALCPLGGALPHLNVLPGSWESRGCHGQATARLPGCGLLLLAGWCRVDVGVVLSAGQQLPCLHPPLKECRQWVVTLSNGWSCYGCMRACVLVLSPPASLAPYTLQGHAYALVFALRQPAGARACLSAAARSFTHSHTLSEWVEAVVGGR